MIDQEPSGKPRVEFARNAKGDAWLRVIDYCPRCGEEQSSMVGLASQAAEILDNPSLCWQCDPNFDRISERMRELRKMPYNDYLRTPEWAEKRQDALKWAGSRREVCNTSEGLNVHHRTYERRGDEDPGDLTVLCKECHGTFHAYRQIHRPAR